MIDFEQFISACRKGNIEELHAISSEAEVRDSEEMATLDMIVNDEFLNACEKGHRKVAEWLWEIDWIPKHGYESMFNHINALLECGLMRACRKGHFKMAKWLLESVIFFNFDANLNDYFNTSDWVLDVPITEKMTSKAIHVFFLANRTGYHHIAQWMRNVIESANNSVSENFLFQEACGTKSIEAVKEMWANSNTIDPHANDDKAFYWACKTGQLEVAEWLWNTIGNINVHTRQDRAFKKSSKDVIMFLVDLTKYDSVRYYYFDGIKYVINSDEWRHNGVIEGIEFSSDKKITKERTNLLIQSIEKLAVTKSARK